MNRKRRRSRGEGLGIAPRVADCVLSVVGQWTRHAAAMLLVVPLLLSGCAAPRVGAPPLDTAAPPAELLDPKYLFEIVRHVYRWHLDENDVDRLAGVKEFPFWVRMLDAPSDAGDRSRMAEITMPLVGTTVRVKKSDYQIDELNLAVRSGGFRIVNVSKVGIPDRPQPEHRLVMVSYPDMRAYLFRTRDEATFPEGALLERLRTAVRTELKMAPDELAPGRQIVHMAPLSPVANEVWVFWETRKLLIRFASDIDLSNPAVWEHEALIVRTWDVYRQVVVSLDESAGSNAFMTRAQIGRALYNCIVIGKRLEFSNPEAEAGATPGKAPGSASQR